MNNLIGIEVDPDFRDMEVCLRELLKFCEEAPNLTPQDFNTRAFVFRSDSTRLRKVAGRFLHKFQPQFYSLSEKARERAQTGATQQYRRRCKEDLA